MNQQFSRLETRVRVPLTWEVMYNRTVSETDFLRVINKLPVTQVLPGLITLLQHGDASEPPGYSTLDSRVSNIFATDKARRITERLSIGNEWIFFSKWQLLFAIKLLCIFGCYDPDRMRVSDNDVLDFLMMTNGFYPHGESETTTSSDVEGILKKLTLLSYSLIQHERPQSLIGRYSELFGRLAMPVNQSEFVSWVDIQEVMETKLGVRLEAFKALLFVLYGNATASSSWPDNGTPLPQLSALNPDRYFMEMNVPQEERNRILELVTTSPDQIRQEHLEAYGNGIGNPVDVRVLLRRPVMMFPNGALAGISGQLLIQRYTCGLYWDIHDALPGDTSIAPNRRRFQTFFGELHERYGRDVLGRIEAAQVKKHRKIRLLSEHHYSSGRGTNPDSLMIETRGRHNTRCTLFEFKVGRPRYKDTILEGDVQAFHDDLRQKIEDGLDQEIDFYRQLQSNQRQIPELSMQGTMRWFFVIVVTDPFPMMGILLEPLRSKLNDLPELTNVQRYGPFLLSLAELEQLETLPEWRVSELLIDWNDGPHRDWPFNTFYAYRIKGQPRSNLHVAQLAEEDFDRVKKTLLGDPSEQGNAR